MGMAAGEALHNKLVFAQPGQVCILVSDWIDLDIVFIIASINS